MVKHCKIFNVCLTILLSRSCVFNSNFEQNWQIAPLLLNKWIPTGRLITFASKFKHLFKVNNKDTKRVCIVHYEQLFSTGILISFREKRYFQIPKKFTFYKNWRNLPENCRITRTLSFQNWLLLDLKIIWFFYNHTNSWWVN